MTPEEWTALATVAQAIFLPASLLFVWHQLRQQVRLTRAANTQSLVELSSPFNLELIKDRRFAELWVKGASSFKGMDEVDQYRFKSLVIWWLILHENIYYQRQQDLIENSIYAAWSRDLAHFSVVVDLKTHWPNLKATFQNEFVTHVDSLLMKTDEARLTGQSNDAGGPDR